MRALPFARPVASRGEITAAVIVEEPRDGYRWDGYGAGVQPLLDAGQPDAVGRQPIGSGENHGRRPVTPVDDDPREEAVLVGAIDVHLERPGYHRLAGGPSLGQDHLRSRRALRRRRSRADCDPAAQVAIRRGHALFARLGASLERELPAAGLVVQMGEVGRCCAPYRPPRSTSSVCRRTQHSSRPPGRGDLLAALESDGLVVHGDE